nr:MAG TPA: hypothetical protein [Caudoviricetes sp.]
MNAILMVTLFINIELKKLKRNDSKLETKLNKSKVSSFSRKLQLL